MEEYTYPGKELWDQHLPVNKYPGTAREQLAATGHDLDMDRIINGPQGEAFMKTFSMYYKYTDGFDPELIQYWKDKGIRKYTPQASSGKKVDMIAYVPEEAYDPSNTKKFPLFVVIPHDILETETRGYCELAAKERFIVIIPKSRVIEDIYSCIKFIENECPVDESRVYMGGFSFPGFTTIYFALCHPEVLAGIAVDCHLWPYIWQRPLPWIVDHSASLKMPIVNYTGNRDFGMTVPIYGNNSKTGGFSKGDAHFHSAEDNLWGANMWMRINDCPEISLEDCMASANSDKQYEREVGLPASRGKVEVVDGTDFNICDFESRDGVYRTRIIAMDNVPHYVWGSMADVTWDFLKHFSRDPKTGESICDGNVTL